MSFTVVPYDSNNKERWSLVKEFESEAKAIAYAKGLMPASASFALVRSDAGRTGTVGMERGRKWFKWGRLV